METQVTVATMILLSAVWSVAVAARVADPDRNLTDALILMPICAAGVFRQ